MKPAENPSDLIHRELALIGQAMSHPHRLRLLNLLAQSARTVEDLADLCGISVALTSAHLKSLRLAGLVETQREHRYVHYRLSSPKVNDLLVAIRKVGEECLDSAKKVIDSHYRSDDQMVSLTPRELQRGVKSGRLVLIDLRPPEEFNAGHIPGARNIPYSELAKRAKPLKGKVVAYCRGPYCLRAQQGVATLRKIGLNVFRWHGGVADWQAEGLRLEYSHDFCQAD